jgi:hypothetical protein
MTAAAVPAKAEPDDVVKFVMGAAALAIIAKSLEDNNRRAPSMHPTYPPRYGDHPDRGHGSHPDYQPPRRGHQPVYNPPRYNPPVYAPPRHVDRSFLPAACAIHLSKRQPPVFAESCMRQYGVTARLPQRCAVAVQFKHKRRTVYDGACLQQAGFDREGRGRY